MSNSGDLKALTPWDQSMVSWQSLIDYLKTVITLASALLAVTIAIADKFLVSASPSGAKFSLGIAWALLVLTVLLAVLSVALCVNYLRKKTRERLALITANLSFFLFVVASIALGAVGVFRIYTSQEPNLEASITQAIVSARSAVSTESRWRAISAEWMETKQQYRIRLQSEPGKLNYEILTTPDGGQALTLLAL